jgi:type II secretory pathway component PulF
MLGLELTRVLVVDERESSQPVREGMGEVGTLLQKGSGLVDAMRGSAMDLPVEAWCLLQAGEHTGKFGEAMRDVGEFLRERQSRRKAFAGQLWYPAMVGGVGIGVMGIILLWVVPRMREMSGSMGLGERLPWLTEHIGLLYGVLFALGVGSIGTVISGILLLRYLGRRSVKWGRWEERILSRLPTLGIARRRTREARLLKQVSTLLRSGTTVPKALAMAAEGCPSQWEKAELERFRAALLMGMGFSPSLRACPLFDVESVPLLEAGQESGRLETYMERIARSREEEAGWKISQATRFIEPLFLLTLSGAIGGLVLAYLLPMVRLLEQAGGAF